jgi:hypothetical protein
MLMLRSSAHIRGSRNLKGLHACHASTGAPLFRADMNRMSRENAALAIRELRCEWLARLWMNHIERCRRRNTNCHQDHRSP